MLSSTLSQLSVTQLNPSVSSFQRRFVSEIKRCEEMERILGKTAPDVMVHLLKCVIRVVSEQLTDKVCT